MMVRTAEERLAASQTIRGFLCDDLKEARAEIAFLKEGMQHWKEVVNEHDNDQRVGVRLYNIAVAERDELQKKLTQANGDNDLLRDQNAQLKAALKDAKRACIPIAHYMTSPVRPGPESTVAENARTLAILDSAEPEITAVLAEVEAKASGRAGTWFVARRIREAALRETDKEYSQVVDDANRTRKRAVARIETDYKERMAAAPQEKAREGAADHAMSPDDDTD